MAMEKFPACLGLFVPYTEIFIGGGDELLLWSFKMDHLVRSMKAI